MTTEYHCEFCKATGTKLRDEEKGCCNNCGAPIGITREQADKIYEEYYLGLPTMSTITLSPTHRIEVTSFSDSKRRFIDA